MTKILFNGCSFTKGTGLTGEDQSPDLWTNQLAHKYFSNPEITNIAETARNNHWIFVETMCELAKTQYDVVIIGWTDTNRWNVDVGLEKYSTRSRLHNSVPINLNSGQTISAEWQDETGNRLKRIQNSHWGILDLVKYINILVDYQVTYRKSKIFFVNSLCPWPENYFEKIDYAVPSELGKFYCELLEVDNRDDSEVNELYNLVHTQYNNYGGIQKHLWLNLYKSLLRSKIDNASATDPHPGIQSQDLFVEFLGKQLETVL
jgi:hypothetical protein